MDFSKFNRRPLLITIAGPNGAGKSTFFRTILARTGLPFVNADVIALETGIGPYEAADLAEKQRRDLLAANESFVFETVFSDPVGDKVDFLVEAVGRGYEVVLCFIRLANSDQSEQRVAARVSKGGHDVPTDKLATRFPRSLANLKSAIRRLPHVLVYDNSDLQSPFRMVAAFENGIVVPEFEPLSEWLQTLIAEQ